MIQKIRMILAPFSKNPYFLFTGKYGEKARKWGENERKTVGSAVRCGYWAKKYVRPFSRFKIDLA